MPKKRVLKDKKVKYSEVPEFHKKCGFTRALDDFFNRDVKLTPAQFKAEVIKRT